MMEASDAGLWGSFDCAPGSVSYAGCGVGGAPLRMTFVVGMIALRAMPTLIAPTTGAIRMGHPESDPFEN